MNLPWPWPRSLHGQLIKALRTSGAKAIVMDIIFSDPSTPREDKTMAKAIQQYGNVVIAGDIEIVRAEKFTREMLVTPIEEFLDAGAYFGVSSIPVDADNVVRRFFWGTQDAPSLELSALRMLGDTREKDYRKMVHFTGPANHIPYVSYHKALKPDFYLPEGFFKDRIIIVGKYSRQSKEGDELTGKYRLHLQPPSPVRGVDMLTPSISLMIGLLQGEIHAYALSLLEDDVLKPLKEQSSNAHYFPLFF
jgi:adenylate cyclase